MNNRIVAVLFVFVSAMLICTQYVTTAIYLSSTESWSEELFSNAFSYVGYALPILSIISLVIGIFVFVYDIIKSKK